MFTHKQRCPSFTSINACLWSCHSQEGSLDHETAGVDAKQPASISLLARNVVSLKVCGHTTRYYVFRLSRSPVGLLLSAIAA